MVVFGEKPKGEPKKEDTVKARLFVELNDKDGLPDFDWATGRRRVKECSSVNLGSIVKPNKRIHRLIIQT